MADVYFTFDNCRIVKTPKGTYRIQIKKKRTLLDLLLFRQRWLSLIVDFKDLARPKNIIFTSYLTHSYVVSWSQRHV